jgi:hypothetical protein
MQQTLERAVKSSSRSKTLAGDRDPAASRAGPPASPQIKKRIEAMFRGAMMMDADFVALLKPAKEMRRASSGRRSARSPA